MRTVEGYADVIVMRHFAQGEAPSTASRPRSGLALAPLPPPPSNCAPSPLFASPPPKPAHRSAQARHCAPRQPRCGRSSTRATGPDSTRPRRCWTCTRSKKRLAGWTTSRRGPPLAAQSAQSARSRASAHAAAGVGLSPAPPQVGLVGDLANGRTVRSLAYLLSKFRGVELFFVAPPVVRMGEDIKAHLTAEGVPWREVEDLTARRPKTLDAQNPG